MINGIRSLKKWCEASWKRDKRFSKVTDETMGTTEGESLLFHLDEFIDDGALQICLNWTLL